MTFLVGFLVTIAAFFFWALKINYVQMTNGAWLFRGVVAMSASVALGWVAAIFYGVLGG